VPDCVLAKVEWMDGRHGAAKEPLPSIDQVPIPAVLFTLPCLHEDRPRGSKAMIDAQGAKLRLSNCRPGAWGVEPRTERTGLLAAIDLREQPALLAPGKLPALGNCNDLRVEAPAAPLSIGTL